MKTKLKYMKLFEGISQSDIPFSFYDIGDNLNINISPHLKELPEIYNQLTDEITGCIWIEDSKGLKKIQGFYNLTEIGTYITINDNPNLTLISGFNNLNEVGWVIEIINNPELTHIEGFNNLTKIRSRLLLIDNPKLISISIPNTLIKSIHFDMGGIELRIGIDGKSKIYKYTSHERFINSRLTTRDCIDKFNPVIYPDIVVKQIIENLELWGEPKTIKTIINHILSKGNYLELIPESMIQYVEERYHHLYNAKHANTGARNIAKMTTGRYLGTF